MSIAALAVAGLGVALLVLSAVGLFRLPDALARQHAATKSTTLAIGLVLLGAALHAQDLGVSLRIVAIVLLLFLTLPVASHMLARAAARDAYSEEELRDARLAEPEAVPPDPEPPGD